MDVNCRFGMSTHSQNKIQAGAGNTTVKPQDAGEKSRRQKCKEQHVWRHVLHRAEGRLVQLPQAQRPQARIFASLLLDDDAATDRSH